jgi:hypothetical protein
VPSYCISFVVFLGILSTAYLSNYSCLRPPGVGFWHEVLIANSEILEEWTALLKALHVNILTLSMP